MTHPRSPRWIPSGPDFRRKGEAEKSTPLAFVHMCWKGGCKAYAAHGRRVSLLKGDDGLWSCIDHLNELETRLAHDAPVSQTEAKDDNDRDAARNLLDGA